MPSCDTDSNSDYEEEGTAGQQRRQQLAQSGADQDDVYAAAAGRAASAGNSSHPASHMNASTSAAGAAGASETTGVAANTTCPTSLGYFRGRTLFTVPRLYLSTGFCQGLQAGTQLQLQVSVHDADWDPDQYMADLAAAAAAAAQGQQGTPANLTDVSSNAEALYNCQAVVTVKKKGNSYEYRISQLQHDGQLDAYLGCSSPYEVVLQEKLGATSLRLYIKPQDPGAPRVTASTKGVSLAGQGMGLQVLPGSVTEVVQDCIMIKRCNAGVLNLPRQLVLSQLYDVLANSGKAGFPVKVELTIVDSGTLGAHTVTEQAEITWDEYMSSSSQPSFRLVGSAGGAMSRYRGRRVVHTSMTADRRITITLAPQAGPAAAAAAATAGTGQAASAAAAPAAAATMMQPGTGGDLTPAAPSTAAAAAAAATAMSPTTPSPTHQDPAAARPTAGGASGGTHSVPHRRGSNNRQQHNRAAAAPAADTTPGVPEMRLESGSRPKSCAAGVDAGKSRGKALRLPGAVTSGPSHAPDEATAPAAADGFGGGPGTGAGAGAGAGAAAAAAGVCKQRLRQSVSAAGVAVPGHHVPQALTTRQQEAGRSAGVSRQDRLTPSKRGYEVMVKAETMTPAAPPGAALTEQQQQRQQVFKTPPQQQHTQQQLAAVEGVQQCGNAGQPPGAVWGDLQAAERKQQRKQQAARTSGRPATAAAAAAAVTSPQPGLPAVAAPPAVQTGRLQPGRAAPAQQPDDVEVIDCTSDDDGDDTAAAVATAQDQHPEAAAAAAAGCVGSGLQGLLLPAGLALLPTRDPLVMELQLQQLVVDGLQALLPAKECGALMKRLRVCLEPFRRGVAAGRAVQQLQCSYGYVRAAVAVGEVGEVLDALGALLDSS